MRRRMLSLVAGILLAPTVAAEDLLEIYQQALDADARLQAAEAAHRATLEVRPQSRAALLPQVSAGANAAYSDENVHQSDSPISGGDQDYNSHGYSLSLQQAVFRKPASIQVDQAESRITTADARLADARQALVVRVAEAYFNLLRAQDNLDFARAEKKAIGQQLRQTRQRFEVGLTAITDVKEAQARYDLATAQEIEAVNGVDSAREALREVTGMEPGRLAELREQMPLVSPEPEDIERWVETAIKQNPQLVAAEATAKTARQEIDRREAEHLPTVDLVAQHGYNDTTDRTFGSATSDTTVSVELNVPLYQGGRLSSRDREAAHLHDQARQELEQARRSTIRNARSAYLDVMAGISRVKALKQSLASTKTALEATEAGFEVGTRTAVDVLNSQQELFRARRDYAGARYDYLLSTLRLKQAAGLVNENDVERINGWLE